MVRNKFFIFSRIIILAAHLGAFVIAWTAPVPQAGDGVAFAQQGGQRALLSDPDGLLKGNAKVKDAIGLINWLLMVSCAVPATIFTIHSGKRFNDQEYGAAFGSAIGAVIAGLGGYIAFSFI